MLIEADPYCLIEGMAIAGLAVGATRGAEVLAHIAAGQNVAANTALLLDLCETMKFGSLCALGGFTPHPVTSALRLFPEDFGGTPLVAAAE